MQLGNSPKESAGNLPGICRLSPDALLCSVENPQMPHHSFPRSGGLEREEVGWGGWVTPIYCSPDLKAAEWSFLETDFLASIFRRPKQELVI